MSTYTYMQFVNVQPRLSYVIPKAWTIILIDDFFFDLYS